MGLKNGNWPDCADCRFYLCGFRNAIVIFAVWRSEFAAGFAWFGVLKTAENRACHFRGFSMARLRSIAWFFALKILRFWGCHVIMRPTQPKGVGVSRKNEEKSIH
ncbi:hypothetical protein TH25_22650 [Thalassospira profundimaris]|uniref:Uncharacterized protein n=1 Tax=Thalassospira profundimaris TaxID=502049 RepID=A0A367WMF1_9PROT|nr:hypothetical protein [Thalassospira profundimaris]RCK42578.1 hypothetical protein TH25_22650 [Thalassospira profundimaris]